MRQRAARYLGLISGRASIGGEGLRRGGSVDGLSGRRRAFGGVGDGQPGDSVDALVVIVVFVPLTHADVVRDAAAHAGAGAIRDYRACSFSVTGEGRFEPLAGASPHIGAVGRAEVVQEQRIEVVCPRHLARQALDAMLAAHPYEEPAWHAYRTLSRDDLA